MTMSFYKRSLQSFLGLSTSKDTSFYTCQPLSDGGLRLIASIQDTHRYTPNVVESAAVKSSPPVAARKEKAGVAFLDDIGGGSVVDGLMSCTESLGFESSDERRIDDNDGDHQSLCIRGKMEDRAELRRIRNRREIKKYPPPISSLNQHGRPNFFLRPVRKDGRLELTEVRIDRPEILRATRQAGRLRLHLVRDEDGVEEEDEEEIEEEEEENDGDGDGGGGDWCFPVNCGEGFRGCNYTNDHRHRHHNNVHVWRQHCVATS